jgi:hypothetical protein
MAAVTLIKGQIPGSLQLACLHVRVWAQVVNGKAAWSPDQRLVGGVQESTCVLIPQATLCGGDAHLFLFLSNCPDIDMVLTHGQSSLGGYFASSIP